MKKHSAVLFSALIVFAAVPFALAYGAMGERITAEDMLHGRTTQQQALTRAKGDEESARQTFETQRDQLRNGDRTMTREQVVTQAHTFLEKSIGYLLQHRRRFLERVQSTTTISDELTTAISDELNGEIDQLNGLTETLNSAEDYTALVTVASDIRTFGQETWGTLHYYLGSLAASGVQQLLAQYTTAQDTAADFIAQLNDEERDTTELTALFSDYSDALTAAQAQYDTAVARFEAARTSTTPNADYTTGKTLLRDALTQLQTARTALQAMRGSLASFKTIHRSGTGTLSAVGNGVAVLIGNGTVTGTADDSTVVVVEDRAGDASMSINGTQKELENDSLQFSGATTFSMTGSDIRFRVTGSGISLRATGTGRAILRGNGTFSLGTENEHSFSDDVTIELTPV